MKKSLFVTTVMMVVLLVVALSTATFAWYTSNNTAVTNATTIAAAESTDANIGIGWTPGASLTNITFDNGTGYYPACPTTLPLKASDDTEATSAIYAATDTVPSASDYIAGGVDSQNYLLIYDLTSTQVTQTLDITTLAAKPYYVTVTGNYEKVSHTEEWVDNGTTVVISGDDTAAEINGHTRVIKTVYTVVASDAETGECTSAQAYNYVGAYVAEGNTIYSYYDYSTVSYDETVPASNTFDCFSTVTSGAMNDATILYSDINDDTYGGVAVKASTSNRYFFQTKAAVAAATGVAQSATAPLDYENAPINLDNYFSNTATTATVSAMNKEGEDTDTFFYVSNNSANYTGDITMTITVSGDNADILRVGTYLNNAYIGTLAKGASDTYFGNILNTAHAESSLGTYSAQTSIVLDALAPSASHKISLYAWYDGVGLGTSDAGQIASFTITFTAA
jgi:hypothetical protein